MCVPVSYQSESCLVLDSDLLAASLGIQLQPSPTSPVINVGRRGNGKN